MTKTIDTMERAATSSGAAAISGTFLIAPKTEPPRPEQPPRLPPLPPSFVPHTPPTGSTVVVVQTPERDDALPEEIRRLREEVRRLCESLDRLRESLERRSAGR